jgi:hypothetical protein
MAAAAPPTHSRSSSTRPFAQEPSRTCSNRSTDAILDRVQPVTSTPARRPQHWLRYKGKPRKETTRKRKARTPGAAASEHAEATPERVGLDFAFKNAWMARVAQGFTKEEVVDLALSTRRPYAFEPNREQRAAARYSGRFRSGYSQLMGVLANRE